MYFREFLIFPASFHTKFKMNCIDITFFATAKHSDSNSILIVLTLYILRQKEKLRHLMNGLQHL